MSISPMSPASPSEPPDQRQSGFERAVEIFRPTLVYCFETEAHVFALAVAASVLLSFFPFLVVMVSLCKYVLHWPAAANAIQLALADFFPGDVEEFIRRHLDITVRSRGPMQIGSLVLLMFTANGVFEPLEVGLNRVWGVARNRSFFRNQLVSMGLIFLCGTLALSSFVLTAVNRQLVPQFMALAAFKVAAVPLSILALALMYWLLPYRRIAFTQVVPLAILVGGLLEGLKYVNFLLWPWLKARLTREYGPFYISVSIVLWSFLAALIILAGADFAARRKSKVVI